ncbi:protein POLR1D [Denticeps clupeoides]|uniref:Uncharacterized protein n=1 Tax=Denticeps clupeoides TaxID=299321 RepID=A0AAY4AM87_9TELE|nr:protein POLR1D [Denticeps clupeoides]
MGEDDELERRAVEELLRETSRARARAETMGPAGWMKCPLKSTNKRFLLNTLRSAASQRPSGGPAASPGSTRRRRDEDSKGEMAGRWREKEQTHKRGSHRDRSPVRRHTSEDSSSSRKRASSRSSPSRRSCSQSPENGSERKGHY